MAMGVGGRLLSMLVAIPLSPVLPSAVEPWGAPAWYLYEFAVGGRRKESV